jgi:hypothetical protein
MANINISTLRDEVLDRLDNSVVAQAMNENIRQKLHATGRVTRAMNMALLLFVKNGAANSIAEFIKTKELVPLSTPFELSYHDFPGDMFQERIYGGMLTITLDGEDFEVTPENNMSIESIRYQAESALYGSDYKGFSINERTQRIYVPEGVNATLHYVAYPETITATDTYPGNTDAPSELPINQSFLEPIATLTFSELLAMGTNKQQRPSVISGPAAITDAEQLQKEQQEKQAQ